MTKNNPAAELIKRLGEDKEFRLDFGFELLQIEERDWGTVVKVAKEFGYSFTKTQLLSVMPDSFFKGYGKTPEVGWNESTRKNEKAGKEKKTDKAVKIGKRRKAETVT